MPPTVENHLQQAYRKLGVTARGTGRRPGPGRRATTGLRGPEPPEGGHPRTGLSTRSPKSSDRYSRPGPAVAGSLHLVASDEGLRQVLARLDDDEAFQADLVRDPKAALEAYELSADDLVVLVTRLGPQLDGDDPALRRTIRARLFAVLAEVLEQGSPEKP